VTELMVRRLRRVDERQLGELAEVLLDCVAGGASVSFMLPLSRDEALTFWRGVASGVERGERALVVALDEQRVIVGTAQVVLAQPDNQPHRGDLAKMLVHQRARRSGAGAALLTAAEDAAREAGKTLLVLDTASAEAERLYARGGWQRVGVVPDYALLPHGGFCDTVFYFKRLA
jgi:GNAT superfamily N-acetyltransferase